LQAYRATIWTRKHRQIRRAQDRALFVGEDGEPLTRQGWNTSWGRVMRNGVADGVIARATLRVARAQASRPELTLVATRSVRVAT